MLGTFLGEDQDGTWFFCDIVNAGGEFVTLRLKDSEGGKRVVEVAWDAVLLLSPPHFDQPEGLEDFRIGLENGWLGKEGDDETDEEYVGYDVGIALYDAFTLDSAEPESSQG